MANYDVLKVDGSKSGSVELNDAVFAIEPNNSVLFEAINLQRASLRQGTHAVKNRSAVRGGGRKPFRQKGTGRARQGSIRAPHYTGGGVVFAPKPRDYSYKVPKKLRRKALYSVLTSKVNDDELIVLEDLNLENAKTKEASQVLKAINAGDKAYIVTAENDNEVYRSFRNIEGVDVSAASLINVYDLVKHNKLVITKDAVAKLEEVFI